MSRFLYASAVLAGCAFWGIAPAAQAQGLVPCAREHGFCRVPYPTRVIYGVPGRSTSQFVQGRGVPCSNEVFGDPAPGIVKTCAYVNRGGGYDRPYGGYGRSDGGYGREGGYDGYGGRRRYYVPDDDD